MVVELVRGQVLVLAQVPELELVVELVPVLEPVLVLASHRLPEARLPRLKLGSKLPVSVSFVPPQNISWAIYT